MSAGTTAGWLTSGSLGHHRVAIPVACRRQVGQVAPVQGDVVRVIHRLLLEVRQHRHQPAIAVGAAVGQGVAGLEVRTQGEPAGRIVITQCGERRVASGCWCTGSRRAASRADWTAGSKSAIKTAMMAMTTSSSIRLKPRRPRGGMPRRFIGGPLQARDEGNGMKDDVTESVEGGPCGVHPEMKSGDFFGVVRGGLGLLRDRSGRVAHGPGLGVVGPIDSTDPAGTASGKGQITAKPSPTRSARPRTGCAARSQDRPKAVAMTRIPLPRKW